MVRPDFSKVKIVTSESKRLIVSLLRDGMTAHGYGEDKIRVVGSDPLTESMIPCVGVNRTNDSLQGDAVGQSEVSWFDEEISKWIVQQSVYYEESLEIRVHHKNADERDRIGHLVKGILTASIPYLSSLNGGPGFTNIKVGNGRDEQENNTPFGPLFWATISLYFWNPLEVNTTTDDPTIEQIDVENTE